MIEGSWSYLFPTVQARAVIVISKGGEVLEAAKTVPEIIDYLIMNSTDITKLVIAFETENENFYVNGNNDDLIVNIGMLEYAKEVLFRGNDTDYSKCVDEQTE